MSEVYNDEKMKSMLKSIYRQVQVSSAIRDRVLRSALNRSTVENTINNRFFLFRQTAWVAALAAIALILISFGLVLPPG
jgi:hypothetical protein